LLDTNGDKELKTFDSPQFKQTDFKVDHPCSFINAFVSEDLFIKLGTTFSNNGSSFLP